MLGRFRVTTEIKTLGSLCNIGQDSMYQVHHRDDGTVATIVLAVAKIIV